LTYPFVASWSLREAMAVGCPIVGSDTPTVTEFLTQRETGLLTPFPNPKAMAQDILGLLEDKKLTAKLRTNARAYAEKHLAMQDYLDAYVRVIERLTGQNPVEPTNKAARKPVKMAAAKPVAPKRKAAAAIMRAEPKRGKAEKPTSKTPRPA